MLKKINRITRDKDFKKIFKRSKKIDTKNLVFRIARRNEILKQVQDDNSKKLLVTNKLNERSSNFELRTSGSATGPRFGFVVSNKINKRATRRNALKRRLRAAVREIMSNIDSNIDAIVLVKKDFLYPYDYREILNQIKQGLSISN